MVAAIEEPATRREPRSRTTAVVEDRDNREPRTLHSYLGCPCAPPASSSSTCFGFHTGHDSRRRQVPGSGNDSQMDYYNKEGLRSLFAGLARAQLLAFIASCAERVLPFYEAFARQEERDDYNRLRHALDMVWAAAVGVKPSHPEVVQSSDHVEAAAPDPGKAYRSPFSPSASDAVHILYSAYQILMRPQLDLEAAVEHAVESAMLARTTVDMYLALVTLPEIVPLDFAGYSKLAEFDYSAMPMFLAEIEKQNADVMLLKSVDKLDAGVTRKLRGQGFLGVQPVKRLSI